MHKQCNLTTGKLHTYRIKIYDHALMRHVCRQTKKLLPLKLSIAALSSKFLEANNKVVLAMMRRLPGGGVRQPGGEHLPLVHGFKRCHAVSFFVRLQKELKDSEEERGHLQGVASTSGPQYNNYASIFG
jgi:hypothetical protein